MNVIRISLAVLVALCSPLVVAAAADAAAAGATIDGIHCDTMEGSVFHIHQHLAIFDHGKPVPIPDDIGRPVVAGCFYWIHTHTPDGLIHIEAPTFKTFVLGQVFDVWGAPLSATAVGPARLAKGQLRAFVDGQPYHGNPRKIELAQHTDITLEAGPPYRPPVPFTNWQGQ